MIGVCEALLYAYKAGLDLETVLESVARRRRRLVVADELRAAHARGRLRARLRRRALHQGHGHRARRGAADEPRRSPGSRSPSSSTSPSWPRGRAARGRSPSSSRSPASPTWSGKAPQRRRPLPRSAAADRATELAALEAEAAAAARRGQDAGSDEQAADEDDPEHRPRRQQPRLRDHVPRIGRRRAGV